MKRLHPRRDAAESAESSAPVGDEHEPLDVRYRRIGRILVQRFNALIRMGRSYSVDNKVFQAQLDLVFLLIQSGAFFRVPD